MLGPYELNAIQRKEAARMLQETDYLCGEEVSVLDTSPLAQAQPLGKGGKVRARPEPRILSEMSPVSIKATVRKVLTEAKATDATRSTLWPDPSTIVFGMEEADRRCAQSCSWLQHARNAAQEQKRERQRTRRHHERNRCRGATNKP